MVIQALAKQLYVRLRRSKSSVVILLIYACLLFLILLKIRSTKETPCFISNSTILLQHKGFRNRVDAYLRHASANPYTFHDPTVGWKRLAKHIYVYSAFIDRCHGLEHMFLYCVKFVGMSLSKQADLYPLISEIKCAFKYENTVLKSGYAALVKIPENHFLNYTAVNFYCSMQDIGQNVPLEYAALYEDAKNITWFKLAPSGNKNTNKNRPSISVCVRPFFGSLSAVTMAEFLAYYSVVGVDHFFFYYTDKLQNFHSLMALFSNANVSMTVFHWDMPIGDDSIHQNGQIVFSQDCLGRSRFRFTHTIIVDTDEFLASKNFGDLKSFVADLDSKYEDAGTYIVQSAYFCDEYPTNVYSPLHILMYKYRQSTAWPHRYRSKYIMRPDRVQQCGIHEAWRYEPGSREILLPASTALLHHYKPCCPLEQPWFFHLSTFRVLKDDYISDDSMSRIQNQLYDHSVIKYVMSASVSS